MLPFNRFLICFSRVLNFPRADFTLERLDLGSFLGVEILALLGVNFLFLILFRGVSFLGVKILALLGVNFLLLIFFRGVFRVESKNFS